MSRVALDGDSAANLASRLAEAQTRLGALRTELTELLADADAALGGDAAATAFRRGFAGTGAAAVDSLSTVATLLESRRRGLVSGVEALTDADADVAGFPPGQQHA